MAVSVGKPEYEGVVYCLHGASTCGKFGEHSKTDSEKLFNPWQSKETLF